MSHDPFWRNVKAGALVHAGDIQGRAPPNEGVTRFKVRQLSQWTAGVQICHSICVTLNYCFALSSSSFFFGFASLKAFPYATNKINALFVTHINGTINLKRLQSQIIHCNPPLKDSNASNWAFMTPKLYPPLCIVFFFILFPSGVCFSSFPPCCGVTLSLSLSGCSLVSLQCTFSLSPLLLPQTWSF